ncbi:hypothetical protein RUM44_002717 [Polyplax serrata]|uniref:Protein phosphatase 1 regulatory subunit 42 n=1 Tax=Polyplax serrata TaxID=468196 RepID=A0ABR1AFJ1_POLSC
MVKLTTKYLFRKLSKKNQLQARRKDESDMEYLTRVTHLHLQSQFIDKIAAIPQCPAISVVYLQNNLLQTIQNLDNFPRLTHLHLEHNYISKMENLKNLTSLKKLYLGSNEISVVEGLEGLKDLVELHLENQRLPQGETLYFDPRTLSHLAKSLKVLNISNNNITSIQCLDGLVWLRKLLVERNLIKDINDVTETLSCLTNLEEFYSQGNPVASDRKYLDAIVVATKTLRVLDGKAVNEKTRTFITNMWNQRENRRRLSAFSTMALDSEESFSQSQGDVLNRRADAPPLGSKLFPVWKQLTLSNGVPSLPSKVFGSGSFGSGAMQKSLKVTKIPDRRSFNYYI